MCHKDQRPCSSCPPILNSCIFCCPSSSQAVPRQNRQVQKTQAIVSPLPWVLQSQPCSTRNKQNVGNADDEPGWCLPSRPAALQQQPTCPWSRTMSWHEGCKPLSLQSINSDWPHCLVCFDKVFCVKGSGCGVSTLIHMYYEKKTATGTWPSRDESHIYSQSQKRYLSHKGET